LAVRKIKSSSFACSGNNPRAIWFIRAVKFRFTFLVGIPGSLSGYWKEQYLQRYAVHISPHSPLRIRPILNCLSAVSQQLLNSRVLLRLERHKRYTAKSNLYNFCWGFVSVIYLYFTKFKLFVERHITSICMFASVSISDPSVCPTLGILCLVVHVDGVRLCLSSAATNGPIV
jgi:hypothetical protein